MRRFLLRGEPHPWPETRSSYIIGGGAYSIGLAQAYIAASDMLGNHAAVLGSLPYRTDLTLLHAGLCLVAIATMVLCRRILTGLGLGLSSLVPIYCGIIALSPFLVDIADRMHGACEVLRICR